MYTKTSPSECTADGDLVSPLATSNCLNSDGTVGSLIGKIGGSTAGKKDGKVFVVGRFCIIDIDDKIKGPLFLTINDEPYGFGDNSGQLKVSVYETF